MKLSHHVIWLFISFLMFLAGSYYENNTPKEVILMIPIGMLIAAAIMAIVSFIDED